MRQRRILGIMFFTSGCVALLMEQVFEKLLSTLLGASMPAASVVLAIYFLGLSLGSLGYAPWLRPRFRNPILAYAALEGAVAVWGILLYGTLDLRYALFGGLLRAGAGHAWTLALARGWVALCWILPPTFCMGATFPAMVDALAALDPARLGRAINRFYSLNLGGAIAGALAGPYLGFPLLGLDGILLLGALFGCGIAFGAYRIGKGLEAPEPQAGSNSPGAANLPWLLSVLALVSGFIFFGLEVVWTQLISAVLGNSVYAFTAMLSWVLIGLGLGAFIMAHLNPSKEDLPVAVLAGLLLLGTLALAFQYGLWQGVSESILVWAPMIHSFWSAELYRWLLAGRLLLLPATLLGMVYPGLFRLAVFRAGDNGCRAGLMGAFNTLGCILGALVTGFWLIPQLGSGTTLRLLALGCLLGGMLLALRARPPRVWAWVAAGILLGLALLRLPAWDLKLLAAGNHVYFSRNYYAGYPGDYSRLLMAHEDTRGGFTTVVETQFPGLSMIKNQVTPPPPPIRTLLTNGKFQGCDIGEDTAQISFALIPSMHLSRFDRALVIGFGTGQSAAVVQDLGFRDVDVAEIAPGILQAADWFPGLNHGVLRQPNVHVFLEDGRNQLLLHPQCYDLITTEISSVWFSGACSLYSQEFYRLGRSRLRPGGMLQQWVQIHHLRTEVLVATIRTLRSVFPYVSFWVSGGQGILVASEIPQVLQAQAAPRIQRVLDDWGKTGGDGAFLKTLAASRLLSPGNLDLLLREYPTPINTDRNRYLEYATPRENLSDQKWDRINIDFFKRFPK